MSKKEKIVYIVHAVDTEGPLKEDLKANFERLKEYFNIKIKPNKKNLKSLQDKKIKLNGRENEIAEIFKKKEITYLENWNDLEKEINYICNNNFRDKLRDSFGNKWVFSWFLLQHFGFKGKNPRYRDIGFSKVFDKYKKIISKKNNKNDRIFFHYHAPSISGDYHRAGSTYLNSNHLFEILCRLLIERNYFPSVFRAGHITERADLNFFLEQWIPFDLSNGSNLNDNYFHQTGSRFGDWRRAPKTWIPYSPSLNDYQSIGNLNRYIGRCLSIVSRDHKITDKDIFLAFQNAEKYNASLLSFSSHDFRVMRDDINKTYHKIIKISKKFKDVKFKFTDGLNAFRHVLKKKNDKKINLNFKIVNSGHLKKIIISTEAKLFGPQPFFAIKTKKKEYIWQNLDLEKPNLWSYTLDYDNLLINKIEKIGIAATEKTGKIEIITFDIKKNIKNKIKING